MIRPVSGADAQVASQTRSTLPGCVRAATSSMRTRKPSASRSARNSSTGRKRTCGPRFQPSRVTTASIGARPARAAATRRIAFAHEQPAAGTQRRATTSEQRALHVGVPVVQHVDERDDVARRQLGGARVAFDDADVAELARGVHAALDLLAIPLDAERAAAVAEHAEQHRQHAEAGAEIDGERAGGHERRDGAIARVHDVLHARVPLEARMQPVVATARDSRSRRRWRRAPSRRGGARSTSQVMPPAVIPIARAEDDAADHPVDEEGLGDDANVGEREVAAMRAPASAP